MSTIKSRLEVQQGRWKLCATINDGSSALDVEFSSEVSFLFVLSYTAVAIEISAQHCIILITIYTYIDPGRIDWLLSSTAQGDDDDQRRGEAPPCQPSNNLVDPDWFTTPFLYMLDRALINYC